MKRYFITTIVILLALALAWSAFGQGRGRGAGQGQQGQAGQRRQQSLSEQERAGRRERMQNMSEEERQQLRERTRQRYAGRESMLGRQEQLKVIEGIEQRLAELKAAIKEGPDRQDFRKSREATPQEQVKFREEWQKARQQQQKIAKDIQDQLTKLTRPRPQMTRSQLPITELRAIHRIAIKEQAEQTAEHVEKLIARYQGRPVEQPARPAQPDKLDEQQTEKKQDAEGTDSGNKEP